MRSVCYHLSGQICSGIGITMYTNLESEFITNSQAIRYYKKLCHVTYTSHNRDSELDSKQEIWSFPKSHANLTV